jgi:hypothetical protein
VVRAGLELVSAWDVQRQRHSAAASPLDEPPGQMPASVMGGPEAAVGDENSCSGNAAVDRVDLPRFA